ncbi:MAG: CHAD domain-containing protein [Bryobacteraceae bacterium]
MIPVDAMEQYATSQIKELLDAMVFQLHQAARLQDPESIHKMRVSIRRLQQALRVFAQYVPRSGAKRIRKRLKQVMKHAGEVRNRDIALKLVGKQSSGSKELLQQRKAAKADLSAILHQMSRPDLAVKWRMRLGLNGK